MIRIDYVPPILFPWESVNRDTDSKSMLPPSKNKPSGMWPNHPNILRDKNDLVNEKRC